MPGAHRVRGTPVPYTFGMSEHSPEPGALHDDPHRNHGLFSDHYLEQTLPGTAGWEALRAEARPVRERVAEVLAGYAPTENEAQIEEDLIRPILRLLGHGSFRVQPALSTPGGVKKPDYVLYRDEDALRASGESPLTEESLAGRAFAVGEAKHWDRPLDLSLKRKGDTFTNQNPSYQISFYMQHAGVEWGILTNGRLWRLYHRDTAHRLDTFYEVDLARALESDEDFPYLYAFFRRAAFDDVPLSNARVLAESAEYARGVGEGLRQQVYEALRHLSQGFLDYPANGLSSTSPDEATLPEVYGASLIVLYRLLFVLYAEARGLLPLSESERYRESYSLNAVKHEVASDLDRGRALLPTTARVWQRLKDLFVIVDEGSPPLAVATFNGGLFDPERHPFLERNAVGDEHLQQAVDRLARVGGEFVDYRDLSERHLGTIYESLLEFRPVPAAPNDAGWSVDLVNDKGERRSSGAYYTPDYVVKYIVDETLGPVLREAVADKGTDEERVRAVLELDVLDPAMGSGHFLVEVTEYIARFLISLGVSVSPGGPEADSGAELAYWKRRVAQSCVYGVDLNPLAVELAKLSLWLSTVAKDRPLSFLDHHLRSGNSLVGASVAALDTGGGSRKRRKNGDPGEGQLSMLSDDAFRRSMSTAVSNMWVIEDSPAETVAEVKEQEELYGRLREELTRRYARLADLSTAARFGLTVDRELFRFVADHASGTAPHALPRQFERWLAEAEEMSSEYRFFHFELEFPEVFFDRYGRPLGTDAGFDAVAGNPPYVRQESLGAVKPYLKAAFPETYHGTADLYVYFYQQGLESLRAGGRMGYIVTNKWLRAGYGEPLRGYFARSGAVETLVDFGHAPVFPDADVFPCILILHRPESGEPEEREAAVATFPREELHRTPIPDYVRDNANRKRHSRFTSASWSLEPAEVDDLMDTIRAAGTPLADSAGVEPYRGVLTGLNDAFLIDTAVKDRLVREDPRSREIIKPYLRGQDIKRWSPDWQNLWMIFARRGIDIDAYPAVKNHLAQYRDRLEPKPKGHTGSWKGRKPGAYKWYEIQDSVDYYELFDQPKLVWQDLSFHPRFCVELTGFYTNDLCFVLPHYDLWMLTALNSPLMWSYMWRNVMHGKDEVLRLKNIYMDKLPIAEPTDEAREEVEGAAGRLVEIRGAEHEVRRETLDWLRVEFGVEKPGQKLEDFAALTGEAFIEEVRKRRPKSAPRLTPAALSELRTVYTEQATPLQDGRAEAAKLERRISDLVNAAYGLTEAEVDLLWRTAPPRMPRF